MQDFLEKNNRALAAKTFFRDFYAIYGVLLCDYEKKYLLFLAYLIFLLYLCSAFRVRICVHGYLYVRL